MVCLLTTDGVLRIYNTKQMKDVLERAEQFTEAVGHEVIDLMNNGPCLLPQ